MFTVVCKGVRR